MDATEANDGTGDLVAPPPRFQLYSDDKLVSFIICWKLLQAYFATYWIVFISVFVELGTVLNLVKYEQEMIKSRAAGMAIIGKIREERCQLHEAVKSEMPEKGSTQFFRDYFKSQRVPFVVYADFEYFTKPIHTSQPNPNESYTKKYQKHDPSGFWCYVKCFDDSVYSQEPVNRRLDR